MDENVIKKVFHKEEPICLLYVANAYSGQLVLYRYFTTRLDLSPLESSGLSSKVVAEYLHRIG